MLQHKGTKTLSELTSAFCDTHKKVKCLNLKLHNRLLALFVAIAETIDLLFDDVDSQEIISKVINNPEDFERLKLIINPQKFVLKNVV